MFVERVEHNVLILERPTKVSYEESDRVVRVDVPSAASKRFWKRHRIRKNVRDVVLDIISKACDLGQRVEEKNDDVSEDNVPFSILCAEEIDRARDVRYEKICVSTSEGTIMLTGTGVENQDNILVLNGNSHNVLYESKISETFRRLSIQEMCAVRSPTTCRVGDAVMCLLTDGTGLVLDIADHENEIARFEVLDTTGEVTSTSSEMLHIVHGSGYEVALNSTKLNGTIRVLNYISGKSLYASRPNTNHSNHIIVSSESIRVSASQVVHIVALENCNNRIHVLDARNGDTLAILKHNEGTRPPELCFAPRRGLLFAADQNVRVWNLSRDLFWRLKVRERESLRRHQTKYMQALTDAVMAKLSDNADDHNDDNQTLELKQARVVHVNQEDWTCTLDYLDDDRRENDVDLDRIVREDMDDKALRCVRIDDVVCVRSCDDGVETLLRRCMKNGLGTEASRGTASKSQMIKLLHVEMRVPKDDAKRIVEYGLEETSPGKYSVCIPFLSLSFSLL